MHWTEDQLAEYLQRRGVPGQMNHVDTSAPPFADAPAGGRLALGRLPVGKMNKTEEGYDAHLWNLRRAGEVIWHKFEAVKLRLADNTFYTPDFAVLVADGVLEMHEVKGFWEDDARVKIKVAADIYPFRFKAFKPRAKKNGGGYDVEEF
jgi:hypothetical protein